VCIATQWEKLHIFAISQKCCPVTCRRTSKIIIEQKCLDNDFDRVSNVDCYRTDRGTFVYINRVIHRKVKSERWNDSSVSHRAYRVF
jgi:hypothetical protein